MNIPNSLTIARIFFVPLLVAVLVQERVFSVHWNGATITSDTVALIIFLLAAATDLLDGYLARRWKQETTIGTLLDPIADKLLVSSALIALVEKHAVAGWLVVLLIGREFAVSGLRSIASAEGYTIKASELGKTKTVAQVVAISLLMLKVHHPAFAIWADVALYVVAIFALWSAVSYFARFWGRIDVATKQRRRQELLAADRIRRGVDRAEWKQTRRERRARLKSEILARARRPGSALPSEAPDLPPSA